MTDVRYVWTVDGNIPYGSTGTFFFSHLFCNSSYPSPLHSNTALYPVYEKQVQYNHFWMNKLINPLSIIVYRRVVMVGCSENLSRPTSFANH